MVRSPPAAPPLALAGRASIMRVVVDLPNAITLAGATLAMIALVLVSRGMIEAALCCVLFAHLADSLDGLVARRREGRPADTARAGALLDTLADFLFAGVFPLILIVEVGQASLLSLGSGMLVCSAGMLRLARFDAIGLDRGKFIGLPLPHNVLVLAPAYLAAKEWFHPMLPLILAVVAIALAALHLSTLRVPKFSTRATWISAVYIAAMTLLLLR
jgi:CDP-diacylglycerol---serine O-phosphatidyltransferase